MSCRANIIARRIDALEKHDRFFVNEAARGMRNAKQALVIFLLQMFRQERMAMSHCAGTMLVKVEDLLLHETRWLEFAVSNFTQLVEQLEQAGDGMPVPLRVLGYPRSRFIEVWAGNGELLMARYTPTEN
jgi:hypothetical protein